jgi:hypothetical protein
MSRYVTDKRALHLQGRLAERDWQIITSLARMRVATAAQLGALHFEGIAKRRARRRLASLTGQRVLARLPRMVGGPRGGSTGHVYALDGGGQRLAGLASGRPPERPRPVGEAFLNHALAVTEVYVRLVLAERQGQLKVVQFDAEPLSWRSFFGPGGVRVTLKPDAYAELLVDGYHDHWFLEVDMGTERSPALTRQCRLYRGYWQGGADEADGGVFPRVLWLAPNEGRAEALRQVVRRQPHDATQMFDVALSSAVVERMLQGAAP